MTDNSTTDKFARGAAIFSLVVSIAAVAIPYVEQRRQFQVLQSEDLTVRLNPHTDGQFRITDNNFGTKGRVVQIPWQLTVSNSGNQKLSVTEYSISTGSSPNSTYYSGIDGGMFNQDQKPAPLPLTLDPGESRQFVVMIGVLVQPEVYKVLSSIEKLQLRKLNYAQKALGEKGLDIYGNKVNYHSDTGESYIITVENEDQKSPVFWYQAVSGRGNVFITSAAEYGQPK